jgi:hypothetical protein
MTAKSPAAQSGTGPTPNPWWFNPAVFILGPVLMSISVWTVIVLSGILRRYPPAATTSLLGFSVPAPVSLPGVVLLATFYLFLTWVAMVGWGHGGTRGDRPFAGPRTPAMSERRYFLVILAVATVGVGYCYATVASRRSVIGALSSQTSNQLYDSLPQNAGVQTLRYACILAAPLGFYLWRKGTIRTPLMVFSVSLLLLNSILASRLSLLMASCVYLTIWVRTRAPSGAGRRRYLGAILATAVVGFFLLTALNYTRNANFYRELGVADPVAMNLAQSSKYVSVPAQVSLGVADFVMTGKWHVASGPVDSLSAITPTFLQKNKIRKADKKKYGSDYGYSSTFAPQYFTNSVFADTYAEYGAWGWFYTFIIYGVAGYLLARLMQAEPVIAATGGVIAYCFAEIWRIQIFTYGFVIFLLLLTAGAAWIARITPTEEDRLEPGNAATVGAREAKGRGRRV